MAGKHRVSEAGLERAKQMLPRERMIQLLAEHGTIAKAQKASGLGFDRFDALLREYGLKPGPGGRVRQLNASMVGASEAVSPASADPTSARPVKAAGEISFAEAVTLMQRICDAEINSKPIELTKAEQKIVNAFRGFMTREVLPGIVDALRGCKGVTITTNPPVSPADVLADLTETLRKIARADEDNKLEELTEDEIDLRNLIQVLVGKTTAEDVRRIYIAGELAGILERGPDPLHTEIPTGEARLHSALRKMMVEVAQHIVDLRIDAAAHTAVQAALPKENDLVKILTRLDDAEKATDAGDLADDELKLIGLLDSLVGRRVDDRLNAFADDTDPDARLAQSLQKIIDHYDGRLSGHRMTKNEMALEDGLIRLVEHVMLPRINQVAEDAKEALAEIDAFIAGHRHKHLGAYTGQAEAARRSIRDGRAD